MLFSSNRAAGFESSSMRGFECSSASIGNWLIGKGPTYIYLGDKSSYLNWCKYKKKTFMKRTCQLYNNGRFSPGWWQFSASSGKTNNWQMRKIKQRRDFFSNCTSFLLCCVDQTLWWYSIVNCNIWIQPLHSIEIEKFWIECNACLPTDDDNSKLEIKVFSKVLF